MPSWFNSTADIRRLGGTRYASPTDLQRLLRQRSGEGEFNRLKSLRKGQSDLQRLLQKDFTPKDWGSGGWKPRTPATGPTQRAAMRKLARSLAKAAARKGFRSGPWGRALDVIEQMEWGKAQLIGGRMVPSPVWGAGWVDIPGRIWEHGGLGYPPAIQGTMDAYYTILDPRVWGWPHAMHYWERKHYPPPENWAIWLPTWESIPAEIGTDVPAPAAPTVGHGLGLGEIALRTQMIQLQGYRWLREVGITRKGKWRKRLKEGNLELKVKPHLERVGDDDGRGRSYGRRESKNRPGGFVLLALGALADTLGGLDEFIGILAEASGWRYNREIGGTTRYNQTVWLFGKMKGLQWLDWGEFFDLLIDNAVEDALYGILGRAAGIGYSNLGVTVGLQPRLTKGPTSVRWPF